MNTEKICVAIKILRKRKGLTQHQLADLLGMTDKAISKWERGLGTPDISVLNTLSKILDIDTDNLLEGNIAYLENDWVGVLRLDQFNTDISPMTETYGKPLVYIYLCYFALVGIRKVYIYCDSVCEQSMKNLLSDGEQYGMKIYYNLEMLTSECAKRMIICGPVFLYGPNLTKYFQRAMSHFASKTVLVIPRKNGDLMLANKNQLSDITSFKQMCQRIPIIFEKEAGDETEFEILGNGMIEFEIRNKDDLLEIGSFLRFLYRTTGQEVYCLKEICQKRGLLTETET